ncbi:MAG: ATP-grasp domain-containing protein [Deltaproteobacteria bacterium]|nr:ATP-grasp domain-containing protein [Deltaproteobacteria bacterium]
MRILIANRGEIARRIMRTAARLGHESVAVYADPDRDAPFTRDATMKVHIGPAALASSYLDSARLLEAARDSGATAVHPGYGFLSESAAFASAVLEAGLLWIGPHPEAIERMGSKIEARKLAASAGVPTIPGFDDSQDPLRLARAADDIGYPVLVKAASGGGGKGIRIVHAREQFAAALEEAANEAMRSFGDADMIVERYIERARHVEVQIVGDRHGNVIDLGTRECSVQRRFQKLLEEAPAPNLSEETRSGLRETARKLAASIGYDSAGTVEYVVDDDTGEFFFLEMNTRLQVEHPVTEEVTGLDIVELQLACAAGQPLSISQDQVRFSGHAFEARINAEDASNDFAPQVGTVTQLQVPDAVRWESGVEPGSEITPHYDSMVAKLVVHGRDRDEARRRLARALDVILIGGLPTNTGFHRWLIDQAPVVEGRVTTRFLETCAFPDADDGAAAAQHAANAWSAARQQVRTPGAWSALGSFRVTPHRPSSAVALRDRLGAVHEVLAVRADEGPRHPVAVDLRAREVVVNLHGQSHSFQVLSRSEHWAPSADSEDQDSAEVTRSPFPAVVTETPVAAGDTVHAGDVVIVIEAMKMLHSLTTRGAGTVKAVHVSVGDSVDSKQVLVSYEESEEGD